MDDQEFWKMFVVILFFFLSLGACAKQPGYPEPPRVDQEVVVDVKTLTPGVPVFFTYHYRGKRINFFVVKMNDRVLSFLDACARCYPAKLGYRYDNGYIICRECNVQYSVSEIEKGFGSCFPIRITGSLRDGRYLIPSTALEGMADKF
jgi:uncharacterized membrane protein